MNCLGPTIKRGGNLKKEAEPYTLCRGISPLSLLTLKIAVLVYTSAHVVVFGTSLSEGDQLPLSPASVPATQRENLNQWQTHLGQWISSFGEL